ncbi:MAG TPA: tetratricopeptide repeat protein [Steroidobacteraceae bacterium]|jgi:predicted negative regulator of RcsB-dependent stress response|nr:tetratricopeptide repeat protein [Steroidobacteraceae bacterium]
MAEEYLTDDEQLEAVKRAFTEYAPWILGGVVLGVGGWFGIQYYRSHQNAVAMQAAEQFTQMTAALQMNDAQKSVQIADGLIKNFPTSPYADQAQLTIARIDVESGKAADAIAPLTQVMNNSKDAELKQVARLRLARVLIDQGKPDDAIKTLAEGTPGSFAGRYHEVHGDALYAKKDIPGAIAEYKTALGTSDGGADAALLQLKLADLASNEKAKP